MTIPSSARWLPVDTVLGAEISAAADAALAPLAAHARQVRGTAISGIALLFGSALVLALLAAGPGGWAFGFAVVAASGFGAFLAVQTHRLWGESPNWMARRSSPAPVPELPAAAALLLSDLRSGRRRARYRRARSGRDIDIPPQMLRGPFGPLLLGSSPDFQSLALFDWLGSDQLWVEIQHVQDRRDATFPPEAADDHVVSLAEEIDVGPAEPEQGRKAGEPGDSLSASSARANLLGLDRRLLLPTEDLKSLLEQAYPPVTRGAREWLIIDALMLGNELVSEGLMPAKVKTLVSRIVAGLKAPDGEPVNLVADDGPVARTTYLFRHGKALGSGYTKVGLRDGSDSSAWIEQAVTGRYSDIRQRLDAAEKPYRAD